MILGLLLIVAVAIAIVVLVWKRKELEELIMSKKSRPSSSGTNDSKSSNPTVNYAPNSDKTIEVRNGQ